MNLSSVKDFDAVVGFDDDQFGGVPLVMGTKIYPLAPTGHIRMLS